jgi:hypothetical protein
MSELITTKEEEDLEEEEEDLEEDKSNNDTYINKITFDASVLKELPSDTEFDYNYICKKNIIPINMPPNIKFAWDHISLYDGEDDDTRITNAFEDFERNSISFILWFVGCVDKEDFYDTMVKTVNVVKSMKKIIKNNQYINQDSVYFGQSNVYRPGDIECTGYLSYHYSVSFSFNNEEQTIHKTDDSPLDKLKDISNLYYACKNSIILQNIPSNVKSNVKYENSMVYLCDKNDKDVVLWLEKDETNDIHKNVIDIVMNILAKSDKIAQGSIEFWYHDVNDDGHCAKIGFYIMFSFN